MLKITTKLIFLMLFMVSHQSAILGQAKLQTIELKKGEVLDILLLTQNPDTEAALKDYFKTAFPVAKRMSYQPQPGFKILQHTQGNLRPESLILGKWSNLKLREEFLTQIIKEVPDFDERRRKIWSYFGLRYYEIQEDLSLTIDRSKYHVATTYWLKSKDESEKTFKSWEKMIPKAGGKVLIQLEDGKSPFGYQYNPDLFVITVWESEAAFKDFLEQTQKEGLDNIQHVNEFVLK